MGSYPQAVAIGDLNGDGKPDLAVANGLSNNVSILLGIGNGNFAAGANFPVGTNPVAIGLADFNNDGYKDLFAACSAIDDNTEARFLVSGGRAAWSMVYTGGLLMDAKYRVN